MNIPAIMGILNGTPDSFYPKSRIKNYKSLDNFFLYSDIIDIGFESTRPNSIPVSENHEIKRLIDFISKFKPMSKYLLSIDTYKPAVAKYALENGFSMINDIMGGGEDGKMFEIASSFNCPIVIMHIKGVPSTMQIKPYYKNIIDSLLQYFENKIKLAHEYGLSDEQIIIDPGIGFGKNIIDNDRILNNIAKLKSLGYPVLIGVSRKSFLCFNNDSPDERLPASLGAAMIAIQNGANIIRTHDVKETYSMFSVVNRINKN